VVACSGGPDSTATLIAVARVYAGEVIAATFDHGMRSTAEAEADRAVVRRVACDLGVSVIEGHAASTPKGEAAARTARYRWLARISPKVGAAICVTGHTRDDQAETVLLRLSRGTGARGAAGMAPNAPWPVATPLAATLRLVRPLLDIARADVEAYLAALGVQAAHDASNDSSEYARNRVRHDVLPALATVNDQVVSHLAAFAEHQREDDEALSEWAERWLNEHGKAGAHTVRLPRKALGALPAAVRSRVLTSAAERLGIRLGHAHLERLGSLTGGEGGQVALAGGIGEGRGTVFELRRDA
jgi:tRNA(Ile)-lysidine synthase